MLLSSMYIFMKLAYQNSTRVTPPPERQASPLTLHYSSYGQKPPLRYWPAKEVFAVLRQHIVQFFKITMLKCHTHRNSLKKSAADLVPFGFGVTKQYQYNARTRAFCTLRVKIFCSKLHDDFEDKPWGQNKQQTRRQVSFFKVISWSTCILNFNRNVTVTFVDCSAVCALWKMFWCGWQHRHRSLECSRDKEPGKCSVGEENMKVYGISFNIQSPEKHAERVKRRIHPYNRDNENNYMVPYALPYFVDGMACRLLYG